MIKYEAHPYAEIFPMLKEQSNEELSFTDSIERHGIIVPIVLYKGMILDGRNRYKAYLGKPDKIELKTEEFEGTDQQALQHVLTLNADRRHLNTSQRALAGWRYARLESNSNIPAKEMDRLVKNLFVVSEDSLKLVSKVLSEHKYTVDEKQVLIDGISQGMPLDFAHRLLTKAPKESWKDAVEGMLGGGSHSGEVKKVNQLIKKLNRKELEKKLSDTVTANNRERQKEGKEDQVYGVVYIDPPWTFEVRSENGKDRSEQNHYPTMTLDEIIELNIQADNNCALFMWVTTPHLANGIQILEAWGFTYKACFIWDKIVPGLGYITRNQVEILLYATKGIIPGPTPDLMMPQLQAVTKGDHSAKPEIFADGITKMFSTTPKFEMFARRKRKNYKEENWHYHGNESEGRIEPEEEPKSKRARNGAGRKKAKEEVSSQPEQEATSEEAIV